MENTQAAPLASSCLCFTEDLVSRPQESNCLSFNGLLFAPLGCDDLAGCHGMFEVKNGTDYMLYGLDGKVRAYIINNARQGRFVVSAFVFEGNTRYMYSTTSAEDHWLRLVDVGMTMESQLIRECKLITRTENVNLVNQCQLC